MNICFLSQEYPPETHVGGIGTYTYNMASALAKLGHAVHVISSTQNAGQTTHCNGVWIHRIKTRKLMPKELWLLNHSYFVAKKVSQIGCRFDIVQASEFASEAFWFALKRTYPLVTRLATPFFLIEKLNGKVFFGPRPLFNWMEKKQTLCSDGIFASTKALADVIAQEWHIERSRLEVIPNSVDLSRIVRLAEEGSVPDVLKGKDFLLYFGRLEERKGVRVLARALPSVFERFLSLNMVFVGSDLGYKGSSIAEQIKREAHNYLNRILFFDNLPQQKLFPIVRAAKMVILPSLWEAFGFVCVEAMALGRPVIATSGSGFEEIIEDEVSGFLVTPGNSRLLSQKIIQTLERENSLNMISEAAKERAHEFEVSQVAHKLLDFYRRTKKQWLAGHSN